LFADALPTFVQVTVHVTLAPAFAGFGVQLTVLVMSAPAGAAFTGTVVLELLLPVFVSFVALVVAGTVIDPVAVGVKLTVHASVPPGATFALGEQLATGDPGSPLVLIEQLAAVAVTVPTFSQIAVQLIGEPTTPGVGVQLTVLTMSDPLGCATIVTVSVPLLLPNAPDGSFVALVVEFTVTVPATVAVKMTLQPKLLPATTSTGTVAFGHTTVAPAGKLAAFVTLHVAPSAVTVLTFVQVTAHETVAPTVAGSGVQTTVLAMSAASATVTVLVQRAGSGATQAGSPLVTLAVLLTLPVVVLVAFRVTTVSLLVSAATPPALVQVMVAGPVAVTGVQAQPLPLVNPVMLTPAGTASTILEFAAEATGPVLLITML